jgi:hypothetical protein
MTLPEPQADVPIFNEIVEFLASRSAGTLGHVHGDLLEHLDGTYTLLRDWRNPTHVCHAGLCHAVYGTDGFATTLLDVSSEREDLVRVIGHEAEALVYFYASCDRRHLYPQIGGPAPVQFRDRFNDTVFVPDESLFASFMELTFANELDILGKNQRLVEETRPYLGALFARCRALVSAPAFAYFVSVFGEPDPSRA